MAFKKFALAAVGALTVAWGPAAHALVVTTYPVDSIPPLSGPFQATVDPVSGVITGTINVIHSFADDFEDTFTFTLPNNGRGSGSITTSAGRILNLGKSGDLDFTSVTINGINVDITRTPSDAQDVIETASIFDVPITIGVLNKLVVKGHTFKPGSYGGQITFVPDAPVPEAATWAMMMIGFGGIGGSMRYRRRKATEVGFGARTIATS